MDLKLTLVQHHYCNFLKFTTQSKVKTNKKNSAAEARQQPKKQKKKLNGTTSQYYGPQYHEFNTIYLYIVFTTAEC